MCSGLSPTTSNISLQRSCRSLRVPTPWITSGSDMISPKVILGLSEA